MSAISFADLEVKLIQPGKLFKQAGNELIKTDDELKKPGWNKK
jgi:hypothetical protein